MFELDLEGADVTRAEMVADLRGVGSVDEDIIRALSQPGVPDWFLANPIEAVSGLDDLRGPEGLVDVPVKWRDGLPAQVSGDDVALLTLLYQRVLTSGTSAEQSALIHQERLRSVWPSLAQALHPVVASVWERRFPQLIG
ncbi:hypothetical protein ACFU5O_28215 [Streptomyces sp. NPDC057445]|uniref:hypothetical protein n=1 Tax=Streptomyces sp. NPDC057445 TaxID=3346136 RepID=UPI0036BB0931